jgi:hypothetical protein
MEIIVEYHLFVFAFCFISRLIAIGLEYLEKSRFYVGEPIQILLYGYGPYSVYLDFSSDSSACAYAYVEPVAEIADGSLSKI